MTKWIIDKQFDGCFGHRVYTQTLDAAYSLDSCHACRRLHGHQATVKVFLVSDKLEKGMVTDFKHLNIFKKWFDEVIDHKFVIDKSDPLFFDLLSDYVGPDRKFKEELFIKDSKYNYWIPNLDKLDCSNSIRNLSKQEQDALHEKYEGMVVVDFIPTSENLCKWWCEVVSVMLKDLPNVTVDRVEYWETPKSHCSYNPF